MMDDNILAALDAIEVADLNREDWLHVGMALKAEGYPCSTWDEWSKPDSRYHSGECQRLWNGFDGSGIAGGTVIMMAENRGWKPEYDDDQVYIRYIESTTQKTFVDRYDYTDLSGKYHHSKIRLVDWKGDKEFRIGRMDGKKFLFSGKKNGKIDTRGTVFGSVFDIKKAIEKGDPVFLVEGEKDQLTMKKKGYPAITYGSAESWSPQIAPLFEGGNVIVLADNDGDGVNVAKHIKKDLSGIAKSVKVLFPYTEKEKGDITDFFDSGGTIEELEGMISGPGSDLPEEDTDEEQEPDAISDEGRIKASMHLVKRLEDLDAVNNYPTNDLGSARLFAEMFKNECRYSPSFKDWAYYDGIRWAKDQEGMQARSRCKDLADAVLTYATYSKMDGDKRKDYLKYAYSLSSSRVRNTIVQDARDINQFSSEELDADDYLLNLQNGTLNLRGNPPVLQAHNPDDLIGKLANVSYDPAAECPLWEKSLSEIMQGDTDKIEYIQKMFGLALTGCTKEEELYFFYGNTSRNGKSTIAETILYLMGDYGATIAPESLATKQNKDSRQASPDLAKLMGVRLVVASEPPKHMLFDVSLVKTLTGRDRITARHLYENEISFTPVFKLLINTNYLPSVTDETIFKSDRIRVIKFDRHFCPEEQNKNLKMQLREELNGILNWMIAGYYKYQKDGLEPPESIIQATEEYERDSDKIGRFIEECLEKSDGDHVSAKLVHEKYYDWCSEAGYKAEGRNNFYSELKARGLFEDRCTINGKSVRHVVPGYKLIDDFVSVPEGKELPF